MRLPNGVGSISKLSGNRRKPFVVRKTIGFDADGKQLVKTIGTYAKRSEALTALMEYNKDSSAFDAKQYTFEKAYNGFTNEKFEKQGKRIPSSYSSAYKRCATLHKVSLSDIKVINMKSIIETAPTTSNKRDLNTLFNQVFKWAVKNEIVERNPAEKLDYTKLEKSEIHQPFTLDEIKTLWKHKDEYGVKLWLIYIYTGVRPSELRLIKNTDIHLEEGFMVGGIKTENSKNRCIPLADCIRPFFTELMTDQYAYLVRNQERNVSDRPVSSRHLTRILAEVCERFNMHHLPHDSRHTTATLLNDADVPLLTIQHILGHSSGGGTTGKIYVHKNILKMLEAVNKLPFYA